MKYYELDKTEQEIVKALDLNKLKSLKNLKKEAKLYASFAAATLDKTKNINLRISEKDLLKIKAKAAEKGIPYQTLLTSLIYQYSVDKFKDRVVI